MPTTKPNQLLKSARKLRGWSQAYVAGQIEAHNYYISRWERGEMMPSPHYQQKLCELFGKTAEELGFLASRESEEMLPVRTENPTADASSESPSAEALSSEPYSLESPFLKSTSLKSPSPEYSTLEPIPSQPPASTDIRPFWRRHVRLLVAVLALLSLLGGLVGVQLRQMSVGSSAVGTFSFVNSGIDNTASGQAVPDEVQIQMTLDRPPASGTAYYAWLMPDESDVEGSVFQLGKLVQHGTTGTLSQSDPRHNLLSDHGSLLITEQPDSPTPQSPLLNDARYQAIIPQTPGPGNPPYTLLDHLRHLLSRDPKLKEYYQLDGGLAVWMVDNIEQLATWAVDAQVDWQQGQTDTFRQDLLDMVDYLDGLNTVGQDQNLPGQGQGMVATNLGSDQRLAGQVGLLDVPDSQPVIEGYLPHIQSHLRGILQSPGVSDQQQAVANQLTTATSTLTDWLLQARRDLYAILGKSSQTPQLLSDLVTMTTYAVDGQPDAKTGQKVGGAPQIAKQILQLLHFEIKRN